MGKEKLLSINNLNVYYGPIQALNNVSLDVYEGEVVALLGANGAGKTTLLKASSGLVKPEKGNISFRNKDITNQMAEKTVAQKLSHVPEHRQVFGTLSVLDNLYLGAYHHYRHTGKKKVQQEMEHVFQLFPILKEREQQLAGTLSGGQQQMLAIARAMMAKPKLLLLDEPTLGLAPIIAKEVLNLVVELNQTLGTTVLLIEQNVMASLKVASRAYVISHGKIIKEDTAEALMRDKEVKEAYLGQNVTV